jgi:hypothetical protein
MELDDIAFSQNRVHARSVQQRHLRLFLTNQEPNIVTVSDILSLVS